jgi:hypothetical protein
MWHQLMAAAGQRQRIKIMAGGEEIVKSMAENSSISIMALNMAGEKISMAAERKINISRHGETGGSG